MSLKHRARKRIVVEHPGIERWLYWRLTREGFAPADVSEDEICRMRLVEPRALEAAWHEHRAEILSAWLEDQPGTRPTAWWLFDAPRQPTLRYPEDFAAQRSRFGGRGTAAHDVLNYRPYFRLGIPTRWVDKWSIAYYTGRAHDVHGNPIGIEFIGNDFRAERFHVSDPPRFESQANYLKRHGLLGEAEAGRLSARDFEPEVLPRHFWPNQEDR